MDTIAPEPTLAPLDTIELTPELARKRKSQFRIIVERFVRNRVSVAGFLIIVVIALLAILAPIITRQTATFDPATDTNPFLILSGPIPGHPLGTDEVGRDELARLLFGGRVSLLVGVATALVAIVIGVSVGALAGFYGGWVDTAMMRVTDAFLSVPLLLVLLVLSVAFSDGSIFSIVILIAFFEWPVVARIVRGEFLSLKEREFLLAARTLGAGDIRLILRHILPNAAGPIIVAATLVVGDAIITESVLSFFNYGIRPPTSSWGTMLDDSRSYITTLPLLLYLPGFAILFTVLSFNLMGDGLRDALDPYMTQR
ncbi:MAG: ABC transporter permease [Ktedonobacterales bacterium]|nr:ABC transporter permease [Ktedonobacterales bacterium]